MSGLVGDNTARASGVIASAGGGGKIVQVVQTYKTDTTTQAGGDPDVFYDISGMSQAITPTKAGSKILVDVCLVVGALDLGTTKVQADIDGGGYNDIGLADESSNRSRGFTGAVYQNMSVYVSRPQVQKFLWTPSYSLGEVITIKCLWSMENGVTVYLNQSAGTTDTHDYVVSTSSLTLWEIN